MDDHRQRRHHSDSRKRSRSPREPDRYGDVKRQRSRSPYHHRSHRDRGERKAAEPPCLPFGAQPLHKDDLSTYRALFAHYLHEKKRLDIERLAEDEVRGRWKSFLGKWNRGELESRWYDPEIKRRVETRHDEPTVIKGRAAPGTKLLDSDQVRKQQEGHESDEDDVGPSLPEDARTGRGPAVPSLQDLQHRQELAEEDRDARVADLRYERKIDRRTQKERLDELAPKAEGGTRERQLEKKREVAASNRAFAPAKDGGDGMVEVNEGDLMGDGEDEFKRRKMQESRRKNERETKKEEALRARAAEREERRVEQRRKEEKTMAMLREIAEARFGGA